MKYVKNTIILIGLILTLVIYGCIPKPEAEIIPATATEQSAVDIESEISDIDKELADLNLSELDELDKELAELEQLT